MEVAAGAVVDEEARVVGDLDVGVERGEERVVQQGEDLGLGPHVRELLGAQGVPVHDLEGEAAGAGVIPESAEEDPAEVPGAEVAEELEVAEVEGPVGGEVEGGLDGGPVWVPGAVGPGVKRRRVGGGSSGKRRK